MRMSCQNVVDLLPWLINGSLGEQRQALRDHLAACPSCRCELAETAAAWQLFAQHVPSLALAEYAQGLPPSGLEGERVERHLALCPSCRQELEWAMADRIVDFAAARSARVPKPPRPRRAPGIRDRRTPWRRLAIAASITAVLVSGGLIWRPFDWRSPVPARDGGIAVDAQLSRGGLSGDPGQVEHNDEARMNVLFRDGFEAGSSAAWSSVRR